VAPVGMKLVRNLGKNIGLYAYGSRTFRHTQKTTEISRDYFVRGDGTQFVVGTKKRTKLGDWHGCCTNLPGKRVG